MDIEMKPPDPIELHLGGKGGPKMQVIEQPSLLGGPAVIESHTNVFPDQPSSPFALQTQIRKLPYAPFHALLMRLAGRRDYVIPAQINIGPRPSEPKEKAHDYWNNLPKYDQVSLIRAVHSRAFCQIDTQQGMTIGFQNEPVYALPHPPDQEPIHGKGEPLLLGKFAWRSAPRTKQYYIWVYATVGEEEFPAIARRITEIISPEGTLNEDELRTIVDLRFDITAQDQPPPSRLTPFPQAPAPGGKGEKVPMPVARVVPKTYSPRMLTTK